jgi:hypothetical protein
MYICLLGLIVRFILVFLALFIQFDHSSNDANKYFEDAMSIADGQYEIYINFFSILYVYFLSLFYLVIPISDPVLANSSSVFIWFCSALVLLKSLNIINASKFKVGLVLIIYSFLPSSIAYTSTSLKEPIMLLLINTIIMSYLSIVIKKNKKYYFLFFTSNFFLIFMHKVFFTVFFLINFLLIFSFFYEKLKKIRFIFIFSTIILLVLIFNFFLMDFVIESLNSIIDGQYVSRASYFENLQIDNDILSFFKFSIMAYINYNFMPFIFHLDFFADFVLLCENVLRFILFFISIKKLFTYSQHKFYVNYLFIFVIYFFIEFFWALGTQNWGTASRHHIPTLGLLLITYCFDFQRIKKIKKIFLY